MSSTQRIYSSLFGPLTPISHEHNAWDYILSKVPVDSLQSHQPFHICVESGVSRTLSEVIRRVECLGKFISTTFHQDSIRSSAAGPRVSDASEGRIRSVGLLSPNHLDYPIVVLACLAAGVAIAPISSSSSTLEASHLVQLAQCEIIFVHPKCLKTIRATGYPSEQIVLIEPAPGWNGATLEDFVKKGKLMMPPNPIDVKHFVPSHHVAVILFSSGSTGNPKGVMLTHRNICSSLQASLFMRQFAGEVILKMYPTSALQPAPSIITLAFLPMNHAYGLLFGVLAPLLQKSCSCIMPKWDLQLALKAIPKYRVSVIAMVPAMATQILAHSHLLDGVDLSSINSIHLGSAPITAPQKHEVLKLFAARGARGGSTDESSMSNGYGMSEATVSITTWPMMGYPCGPARSGTIGVLLPGLEARIILDDSSGQDAPTGTAGELWLRGPTIMKGYLNNESETQAALTPDGWFKTGDKIRIEADGQMFYVDRIKDTFKNRGLQVAPSEISSLILHHLSDLLADVVVIGIPTQEGSRDVGEEAWAFVVMTPEGRKWNQPADRICQAIRDLTRSKLSKHKWVSRVEIMDELPKGPTHKILVREIRAQAIRKFQGGDGRAKL